MKYKTLLLALITVLLASCVDTADTRAFFLYDNAGYRLRTAVNLHNCTPVDYPYISQFPNVTKDDYYTDRFDLESSHAELRVTMKDGLPYGYGTVRLCSKEGITIVDVQLQDYKAVAYSYQYGVINESGLYNSAPLYFGLSNILRFQIPASLVDGLDFSFAITLEYYLEERYPLPEGFKDLTWLL